MRVGVHDQHAQLAGGQGGGQIDRQRRLADTTFLIDDRDNHEFPFSSPAGSRFSGKAENRLAAEPLFYIDGSATLSTYL